jgi:hypothetical protein
MPELHAGKGRFLLQQEETVVTIAAQSRNDLARCIAENDMSLICFGIEVGLPHARQQVTDVPVRLLALVKLRISRDTPTTLKRDLSRYLDLQLPA